MRGSRTVAVCQNGNCRDSRMALTMKCRCNTATIFSWLCRFVERSCIVSSLFMTRVSPVSFVWSYHAVQCMLILLRRFRIPSYQRLVNVFCCLIDCAGEIMCINNIPWETIIVHGNRRDQMHKSVKIESFRRAKLVVRLHSRQPSRIWETPSIMAGQRLNNACSMETEPQLCD